MPAHKIPAVLVVDDIEWVRGLMKYFLPAQTGCRVITAETTEQALELAELEEVDVAISDLVRPGVNGPEFLGFELMRIFKLRHPDVPIIISSGNVHGEAETRAYGRGAFRCLLKPQTPQEILTAVQEALEHRATLEKAG